MQSLAEQQDKLEKLSKDYYQESLKNPRHVKTLSNIPNSINMITHSESTRNIKSSLGDIQGYSTISTAKHSEKRSFDIFSKKESKRKDTS